MKKLIVLSIVALFSINSNAQNKTNEKPKQMVSEVQIVRMKAELMQSNFSLSKDQTNKVEIIMNVRNTALKSVREKVGENQQQYNVEAMPIRQNFQDELKAIFTKEQYTAYNESRLLNRRNASVDNLVDQSEFDLRKE